MRQSTDVLRLGLDRQHQLLGAGIDFVNLDNYFGAIPCEDVTQVVSLVGILIQTTEHLLKIVSRQLLGYLGSGYETIHSKLINTSKDTKSVLANNGGIEGFALQIFAFERRVIL